MFSDFNSRFKFLGKSALLLLLIGSIYGCEKFVDRYSSDSPEIALAKVESGNKLIAQVVAQDGRGTEFSGLPILASSRFVIKPDKREEFIQLINNIIPKVRMNSGNISYSLYEEINNPNSFLIFEEWKSKKSLQKFIATNAHRTKERKIMEISVQEPSFKIHHFQSIDFQL